MITRFAPSPTGPLHLGHAFSALTAYEMARAAGGRFLLRIEDVDTTRSRPEWEAQIYDDLRWLGIRWEEPVLRQANNRTAYDTAIAGLARSGLVFSCHCNRSDIRAAMSAPQEGAPLPSGPDGLIYPGTCRDAGHSLSEGTLRLKIARAVSGRADLTWQDGEQMQSAPAQSLIETVGDVVLQRRDTGLAAYHLAVVIDDAAQGVTDVIRGEDLREATVIHVLLQRLLELPTPRYHHHRLIRDEAGKRLAKRDDARAIATFRTEGASPSDIRAMVGL